MFPPGVKELDATNLRKLGGAMKKYVRSKYLMKYSY